jgi:LysR family glycine cleavage system transcriptional activator
MALEAAIEGQGVALAGAALVGGDLRAGRLVRPFAPSASQATAFCYYLVYPEAKAGDPKVMAFRDWMLAEVARDENPAVFPT